MKINHRKLPWNEIETDEIEDLWPHISNIFIPLSTLKVLWSRFENLPIPFCSFKNNDLQILDSWSTTFSSDLAVKSVSFSKGCLLLKKFCCVSKFIKKRFVHQKREYLKNYKLLLCESFGISFIIRRTYWQIFNFVIVYL